MIGCDCNAGLSNTGRPNCVPIQSVVASLILVPLTANDGTKNRIDLALPFVAPVWNSLVNEADPSKRWFPLPTFENVELPKADSLMEEAASGKMAFLRQGKRSFTGELWAEDSTPNFLGKLEKSRCVDFGLFIVDVNGNLIGSEVGGFLYPIPVDNSSWNPTFMFATDTTVQKIMLAFDFNRQFDESTMFMITPEESGIDFNTLEGLVDVIFTNATGAAAFTSVTFDAKFSYGTAINKLKYIGATTITDWNLDNLTTPAALGNPTGIIELPDGTYELSFLAQNSGDIIKVTVTKDGFSGDTEITLP